MFHFFKRKLTYYYVSPLDRALDQFRQKRKRTQSQTSEHKKHSQIMQKRDQAS